MTAIALREIEQEPADVDVRRVLVLGVPGLVAHQPLAISIIRLVALMLFMTVQWAATS